MNRTKETPLELAEGEIYAGSITAPTGEGYHLVLLPGDHDDANWKGSMDWAKSIGGELPDRVEQALLFKYLPEHFQKEWYWSSEQHSSDSGYAWYQDFRYGNQGNGRKLSTFRARAVRRSKI